MSGYQQGTRVYLFRGECISGNGRIAEREENFDLIMERRPNVMRAINSEDLPWEELTMRFAWQALDLFKNMEICIRFRVHTALWRRAATSKAGMKTRCITCRKRWGTSTGITKILPLYGYHGQASSVCSHGYHFH